MRKEEESSMLVLRGEVSPRQESHFAVISRGYSLIPCLQ
jgi:hypothetical protein